MRNALVKVTVATVFMVLGVSACGGSDESADPAAEALAAQVEEICAEWDLSFADRGEFPVADFDPENPDPADLPAVGEYFAAGLETQPQAIEALRGLSATGELREQLDALIAAWEGEYANAKAQSDAAIAADVEGFVATLDGAKASNDAVNEAANVLGATNCGR